MYGRFGKMQAYEGQRDTLIGHLLAAAHLLRQVDGCLLYVVSSAPDDSQAVWVMEVWRSQADHLASLTLDAVKDLIAVARPLIASIEPGIEFVPHGGKGLPESGMSQL